MSGWDFTGIIRPSADPSPTREPLASDSVAELPPSESVTSPRQSETGDGLHNGTEGMESYGARHLRFAAVHDTHPE